MPELNAGDTAWVLASAALVLLMVPALALFYGGMVRQKSVLNMMMMSFGALAVIGVIWVLWGYSMAFGSTQGGLIGSPGEFFGLKGLMGPEAISGTIPTMAFVGFQGMFAILTVALISGAIADRAKFGTWLLFGAIWATMVYFPVAHWVWGGGWIYEMGAIDFAGGTAVHINSGAAALALALVLGTRIGFGKTAMRPHNLPLVMLGAGLLWFGWIGFNAGSALAADTTAATVLVMTVVATATASLAWMAVEKIRDGHATSLGAASGVVAGLVGITPACASVNVVGAIAIGVAAGVLCSLAVGLKYKLGYDDSLDVVGIHMVGGLVGCLMIGLVATEEAPTEAAGLFYGGGFSLLGTQAVGAVAVLFYSFIVAFVIGFILQKTIGFRVDADVEQAGVDINEHAETAYELTEGYGGTFAGTSGTAAARNKEEVTA
jgi:ammonium transporter, Amt family